MRVCMCVCVDYFISHHTRTCNRITFHYSEPNLLLTGSQDGSVALIVRLLTYLLLVSMSVVP